MTYAAGYSVAIFRHIVISNISFIAISKKGAEKIFAKDLHKAEKRTPCFIQIP
jgi:hypothetical protein